MQQIAALRRIPTSSTSAMDLDA